MTGGRHAGHTGPLKWLAALVRHPGWIAELLVKPNWGQRSIVVLVMQTLDGRDELQLQQKRDGG